MMILLIPLVYFNKELTKKWFFYIIIEIFEIKMKKNNIMLRIEDYYLIRTGMIDVSFKKNLDLAI